MKAILVNENYKSNWVEQLLKARGIKDSELEKFYHPSINNLQNPECLDNIHEAAAIIIEAIQHNKHLGLLMDCDVDGITSSTIIYHYIKELNPDIQITYFFHDHKQHGLEDSWEKFIEANIELLIQPDSGINDKQYHDILGQHNIFTIVADHHEYENTGFSESAIYVDNQISENYQNKSLAGCGVVWQLCRMIDKINGTDYAFKYIDLVALGCAADVMSPLTLENRFIFDYGFSHIQDPVFKAIIDKQSYSMKGIVNYTSVAFYVAPLINACMRSGTYDEKKMMYEMNINPFKMVESHKRGAAPGTMVPITEECLRILTNVKSRQQRLIDNYSLDFDYRIKSEGLNDNNIIILHLNDNDNFDAELNGLIATKFSNLYNKPCLVLRDGLDNLTKGSGRNPNGSPVIDLKELIAKSPYTDFVAGHASAFGTGIKTPCLNKFVNWFNEQTSKLNFNENSYQVNFEVTPDCEYLSELCIDIASHDHFWGGDNIEPLIYIKNLTFSKKDVQIMGKNENTIKITKNGVPYIKFFATDFIKQLEAIDGDYFIIDIIGKANLNKWMGRSTPQIIIEQLELKDNIFDF